MSTTVIDHVRRANEQTLARYLVDLKAHLPAYRGINPFWREITDTFRNQFAPPEDIDTASQTVDRVLAQIDAMPKTGYFVQPVSEAESKAAWRQILADRLQPEILVADKARYETAIAADFLAHAGLLDEARRTLHAMRMEPKYVTLRHFFYFTQLREALEPRLRGGESADVLEIGAGGSTLKLFLKRHFGAQLRSYCIVDLPEMLCLSAKASIEFFPDEPIGFVTARDQAFDPSCPNIFVPAHAADMLREARFDAFVNTHSFQEMDPTVIASYFDLIYQTAKDGAVFFQTNLVQGRMTRLDGSRFYSDPARYPFRPTDTVVYACEDPFHVYARERFGYKPQTRTLTSIRRVRAT